MFRPDPSIQVLPSSREQVVAIVESINQPQVSIPGKPAQAVHGHLCGIRNANGTFSIYVGLHLLSSGENVVYVNDRRQLAGVDEYRAVEMEGLQFLESMGFMLDNLNFRNLPPDAQDKTLGRIPLFTPGAGPSLRPTLTPAPSGPAIAAPSIAAPSIAAAASAAASASPPADDAARIARLLASF
ncbi:MAG TPA: hypothetical protein VLS93_14110 [Anaeromyxobacteraceae bacterium]|nr:hypothetical protein [Anaeromyxobacteraceae bacterium]